MSFSIWTSTSNYAWSGEIINCYEVYLSHQLILPLIDTNHKTTEWDVYNTILQWVNVVSMCYDYYQIAYLQHVQHSRWCEVIMPLSGCIIEILVKSMIWIHDNRSYPCQKIRFNLLKVNRCTLCDAGILSQIVTLFCLCSKHCLCFSVHTPLSGWNSEQLDSSQTHSRCLDTNRICCDTCVLQKGLDYLKSIS